MCGVLWAEWHPSSLQIYLLKLHTLNPTMMFRYGVFRRPSGLDKVVSIELLKLNPRGVLRRRKEMTGETI